MQHIYLPLHRENQKINQQLLSKQCTGNTSFLSSSLVTNWNQNRYQELIRVEREWRYLKNMMWHGFAHEDRQPGSGELAHHCPTCPQPGINLLEGWEQDPNQ